MSKIQILEAADRSQAADMKRYALNLIVRCFSKVTINSHSCSYCCDCRSRCSPARSNLIIPPLLAIKTGRAPGYKYYSIPGARSGVYLCCGRGAGSNE